MATCYYCGSSNADYRRTVETGTSKSTYYGKKSTSFSTRTNSGIRSLCYSCAKGLDISRSKSNFMVLFVVAIIEIYYLISTRL